MPGRDFTGTGRGILPAQQGGTDHRSYRESQFLLAKRPFKLGHAFADTTILWIIDGSGSAITTGSKGYLYIHFACEIKEWEVLADQSGSVVVDVKKTTYSSFPSGFASIAGTEKPTLSSAQKNQDTNLTSWTTTLAEGDVLEFNVDSASTVTWVLVTMKVRRLAD